VHAESALLMAFYHDSMFFIKEKLYLQKQTSFSAFWAKGHVLPVFCMGNGLDSIY